MKTIHTVFVKCLDLSLELEIVATGLLPFVNLPDRLIGFKVPVSWQPTRN